LVVIHLMNRWCPPLILKWGVIYINIHNIMLFVTIETFMCATSQKRYPFWVPNRECIAFFVRLRVSFAPGRVELRDDCFAVVR
jgi:hypothetical protein